jgi:hypothetical protein
MSNNPKAQRAFIHQYNEEHRPHFNKDLFVRTDDELVEAIRDIIYSCERDSTFTIKVMSFEVIDGYDDINHILWEYEDYIINKGKKSSESSSKRSSSGGSRKDNQFAYINLKDSDLKLIKVIYFIQINEKKNGLVNDTVTVYIAIPRIVDNFYFRINGNLYSAMYQIVDASTYNNSASKSAKKQSITFKTVAMPVRLYRYTGTLTDIDGESIPCTYFVSNIFKKSFFIMKYILAKMGFYGAMEFLKIIDTDIVADVTTVDRNKFYVFQIKDEHYIVVPKVLYNSVQIYQSFVYTVSSVINCSKDESPDDFKGRDPWIKFLGMEFTTKDLDTIYDKGNSILGSLEFIYDKSTMRDLKLSMEDKADIYRILRWMMYEFNSLRKKDNLDISTKKVRWAEYIASLYASRLVYGIYRISDKGDTADITTIRKAIQIPPMYLINAISKCQLVNYKSCINDMDSIIALKYTYKGVSGIGEKSNAISSAYRAIHPSHLGRVDIDSSSNSDPGISGTICPLVQLHDGHFDEYEEPSTWEAELARAIDMYKSMESKRVMCRIIKDHGLSEKSDDTVVRECISIGRDLTGYMVGVKNRAEYFNGVDLFGDGYFYFLEE